MTERCGWMLQCVKLVGHDGQHEVTSLRTLNPPAAAPAAEPGKTERQTCVPCQGTGRKQGGGGWGLCPDCNGHGFVTVAPPSEPAAPAPDDPCQRCGKLGGHGVDFRFDGILMGSWICPHCLDAQEKRIAELEAAIRWALGEEDEFATREPGEGAYWWRTELRRRAKLAVRAATSSTPGDGSAKK